MQTLRLKSLINPAQTETLIDACVHELGILPHDALKLRETWRLPIRLLDIADGTVKRGEVWSAWSSGDRAWLFVGHLALDRARERGQPVLEIDCYDTCRRNRSHVVSTRTPDGGWQACTH